MRSVTVILNSASALASFSPPLETYLGFSLISIWPRYLLPYLVYLLIFGLLLPIRHELIFVLVGAKHKD